MFKYHQSIYDIFALKDDKLIISLDNHANIDINHPSFMTKL